MCVLCPLEANSIISTSIRPRLAGPILGTQLEWCPHLPLGQSQAVAPVCTTTCPHLQRDLPQVQSLSCSSALGAAGRGWSGQGLLGASGGRYPPSQFRAEAQATPAPALKRSRANGKDPWTSASIHEWRGETSSQGTLPAAAPCPSADPSLPGALGGFGAAAGRSQQTNRRARGPSLPQGARGLGTPGTAAPPPHRALAPFPHGPTGQSFHPSTANQAGPGGVESRPRAHRGQSWARDCLLPLCLPGGGAGHHPAVRYVRRRTHVGSGGQGGSGSV